MNLSTAVFLIEDGCRAIMCTYESHDGAPKTLFKTLDKTIEAGNYVVIPTDTRHKMTVVKVEEVDVDFNLDSPTEIAWIIGKVALADYDHIVAHEKKIVAQISAAEKLKKKIDLKETLEAHLKLAGIGSLKELSIAAEKAE